MNVVYCRGFESYSMIGQKWLVGGIWHLFKVGRNLLIAYADTEYLPR